ncbi:MAG: hypothetical protein ACRDRU_11735 [Pseudonocardiaceae bacterium]
MTLTSEQRQQVADRLRELGATMPCPRCTDISFSLVDELAVVPVCSQVGGSLVGGLALPAALLVCNQCGFLSYHALTKLGLAEEIVGDAAAEGGRDD